MSSQDISEQLCQLEFLNRDGRRFEIEEGKVKFARVTFIHIDSPEIHQCLCIQSVELLLLLLPNELFVGALGKFSQTRQSIHLSVSSALASHKWIEWKQQQQTITHRKRKHAPHTVCSLERFSHSTCLFMKDNEIRYRGVSNDSD